MKNALGHQPALTGRCDYLGLKDDSQTCLAFPSNWNYCHHAGPPESIRLEHQRQYCHTPNYVQCPVFQNEKIGPLPLEVRGMRHQKKSRARRFARIPAVLFILALALVIFWLAQSPSLMIQIKSGLFGKPPVNGLPFEAIPVLSFVTVTPLVKNPLVATPPTPGIISTWTVVFAPPDYSSGTTASQTFRPLLAVVCGHPLDMPFGTKHQFVIHQAHNGESLNMYASNYRTSVDAIRAVNYRLPIPLRKEWVLVIPIGETEMGDLPAFEPDLVSEANSSIKNLASKFSAEPLALKQYNDFDESCHTFSGWLLIPRVPITP